ncbi:hypothetical protein MASR1M65_00200 [Saprospiraceae bacterium]
MLTDYDPMNKTNRREVDKKFVIAETFYKIHAYHESKLADFYNYTKTKQY